MKIINCKIVDTRSHSIDSDSRLIEIVTDKGKRFVLSTREVEDVLIDRGELCNQCRGDEEIEEGEFDSFNNVKCECLLKE